jgi:ER degradation enhancer, mannosidase alpha-like 1
MKYIRDPSGYWYRNVNMESGAPTAYTTDSLSAFWAGVQILAGDIEGAIRSHLFYAGLWMRYGAIPEGYGPYLSSSQPHNYPLRPGGQVKPHERDDI